MFLAGEFMVIWIFYAVCGLGILFFAAFFFQCCRLSARTNKHVVGELSISDIFPSAQRARLLAQWDREMAEFMARHRRSTARLFLIAASSAALLSFVIPSAPPESIITQVNRRAPFIRNRSASLDQSQGEQVSCKKS